MTGFTSLQELSGNPNNDELLIESINTSINAVSSRFEIRDGSDEGYTMSQTYPVSPNKEHLLTVTYYDQYGNESLSQPETTGTPGTNPPSGNYESISGNQSFSSASQATSSQYYVKAGGSLTFTGDFQFSAATYGSLSVYSEVLPTQGNETDLVKGQITTTKTRILDPSKDTNLYLGDWLTTSTFYDEKYRPVRVISENHLGGKDIIETEYDFVGTVLATTRTHQVPGKADVVIKESTEYDHALRPLHVKHKVNNEPEITLVSYEYNQLGQQIGKHWHGNEANGISTMMNIRGWTTSIAHKSESKYKQDIKYYEGLTADVTPQYNGNIAAIEATNNGNEQAYNFSYDALNRLTAANSPSDKPNYSVTDLSYDLNGNIKSLNRLHPDYHNINPIDALSYNYEGNKLLNVQDASDFNDDKIVKDFQQLGSSDLTAEHYGYDKNGN
ncbi:hypothetical protein [Persicobacter psychrovividus]